MTLEKDGKCFSSFAEAFAKEDCYFSQEEMTLEKEGKCFSSFAEAYAKEAIYFSQQEMTLEKDGNCFSSFAELFAKEGDCLPGSGEGMSVGLCCRPSWPGAERDCLCANGTSMATQKAKLHTRQLRKVIMS